MNYNELLSKACAESGLDAAGRAYCSDRLTAIFKKAFPGFGMEYPVKNPDGLTDEEAVSQLAICFIAWNSQRLKMN